MLDSEIRSPESASRLPRFLSLRVRSAFTRHLVLSFSPMWAAGGLIRYGAESCCCGRRQVDFCYEAPQNSSVTQVDPVEGLLLLSDMELVTKIYLGAYGASSCKPLKVICSGGPPQPAVGSAWPEGNLLTVPFLGLGHNATP